MADRVQQARERAERVLVYNDPLESVRRSWAEDVIFLADRVAELETALRKHGRHTDDCEIVRLAPIVTRRIKVCTCGLHAALAGSVADTQEQQP